MSEFIPGDREEGAASHDRPAAKTSYIFFVSAVLLFANVLNYADRYIISVLAEPIKRDLGLSDADLGFLYGTSFVVLATIGGIAIGQVADTWLRNRLLSLGVLLWSGMTIMSGFAVNFAQLAFARVGVGIGEAAATPVSYSLLAEVVPSRRRSMAFAVYLSGVNIGGAVSLTVGGWLADHWHVVCTSAILCGVRGWQSAFLLFGALGIAAALMVWALGDPDRERRSKAKPIKTGFSELSTLLPPFTFFQLARLSGQRGLVINLIAAAAFAGLALLLTQLVGNPAQWAAVGVSLYAAFSWCQANRARDPDFFNSVVMAPAFIGVVVTTSLFAIVNAAVTFWATPFAVRTLGVSLSEAGLMLGGAIGLGAIAGQVIGGIVGDWLRQKTPLAALILMGISAIVFSLAQVIMLLTHSMAVYTGALTLFALASVIWFPSNVAVMQDFVHPHMRARAAALYVVITNLTAMSFGPYMVGKIGDALGGLSHGLWALLILSPLGLLMVWWTSRHVPSAVAKMQKLTTDPA